MNIETETNAVEPGPRPRYLPKIVVIASWLIFIVSFFLPATDSAEMGGSEWGDPLTGWQAFVSSLEVPAIMPLVIFVQPHVLLFLLFPFINFLMLCAPLLAFSWDDSWILSSGFCLFGFLPWVFPKEITGDWFIGFYLWDASFFAMAVGCVLMSLERRRLFVDDIA